MDNNIISHRASGRMNKLQSPVSDAEIGQGKPDAASPSNASEPVTGLQARATDYGQQAAVRPRVSLPSTTGAAESGASLDLEAGITERGEPCRRSGAVRLLPHHRPHGAQLCSVCRCRSRSNHPGRSIHRWPWTW